MDLLEKRETKEKTPQTQDKPVKTDTQRNPDQRVRRENQQTMTINLGQNLNR